MQTRWRPWLAGRPPATLSDAPDRHDDRRRARPPAAPSLRSGSSRAPCPRSPRTGCRHGRGRAGLRTTATRVPRGRRVVGRSTCARRRRRGVRSGAVRATLRLPAERVVAVPAGRRRSPRRSRWCSRAWLARGMTQPLRDMARAARRMARATTASACPHDEPRRGRPARRGVQPDGGELESLERLRRDLVANVSHELKTPISALRAHLENLLDGVEQPNPATRCR